MTMHVFTGIKFRSVAIYALKPGFTPKLMGVYISPFLYTLLPFYIKYKLFSRSKIDVFI